MAFHGFDLRVQRRQVQFLDQLPNQSRLVVGGNQIVNPLRVGIDLRAVGRLHPRRRCRYLRASILRFHDSFAEVRCQGASVPRKRPNMFDYGERSKTIFFNHPPRQ